MIIAGTVPIRDFPLTSGTPALNGDHLMLERLRIPRSQGTGALISAALVTCEYLKTSSPSVVVAGDIGEGEGSRKIYDYLIREIPRLQPSVLALHYCLPDLDLMRRLWKSVEKCNPLPFAIADAGSMYAAKAVGIAKKFDILTPDLSELSFLADPDAQHPAYINKHLFAQEIDKAPDMIATAYRLGHAPKVLLVKGAVDFVAREGSIVDSISDPDLPALEAIGGTGDTITGLIAAFLNAELDPVDAARLAARSNRMAGQFARATPATKIGEIINCFPAVFQEHLCRWSGVCVA